MNGRIHWFRRVDTYLGHRRGNLEGSRLAWKKPFNINISGTNQLVGIQGPENTGKGEMDNYWGTGECVRYNTVLTQKHGGACLL